MLAAASSSATAAVSGDTSSLTAIAQLSEPHLVHRLHPARAVGRVLRIGLALLVRQGTHELLRDLGLRFRWIDLVGIPIGVGGQILVALIYVPIPSTSTTSTSGSTHPASA